MKYFIQTYGCQMNVSDSERVSAVLEAMGYEAGQSDLEADLLIFNTCSVKQKAEDRVLGLRKNLASLKKKNKDLLVSITGCMVRDTSTRVSEKKDALLRQMPELDFVFRIEEIAKLPELVSELNPTLEIVRSLEQGELENYFQIAPKLTTSYSVFVPIQTGCDKFCTYCIVPFTRGREYSRDFEEILAECTRHVENGAVEITLVGQTVNTYGLSYSDRKSGKFSHFEGSPFAALLLAIDELWDKGLRRLRFTSPHPRDFKDDVIAAMAACKSICPYVHMPVQSGDDRVLRRMNRNYLKAEYVEIMKKIQAAIPNCAISTDIIVGFSGETEEEFENTYQMYKEMEWDLCFLSRYSPRKGTYSEKKLPDDVSPKVKAERWHRLNDLLREISRKKHAAFLGKTLEVLVTEQVGQTCLGRSREFKEVRFKAGRPLVGQLVEVEVTQTRDFSLEGQLV